MPAGMLLRKLPRLRPQFPCLTMALKGSTNILCNTPDFTNQRNIDCESHLLMLPKIRLDL